MKTRLLILAALMGLSCAASAAVYNSGTLNYTIPDANPSGVANTLSVGDWGSGYQLTDVSVTFNVSGGYNGDLYAYISHNGVLVPLINRVGVGGATDAFGYANSGFSVTLSDSGAYDIHWYQDHSPSYNGGGQLTSTWQADGRAISPLSSPSAFDSAGRTGFSALNGLDPNGSWTLFFADLSSGDQSQLVSWTLSLDAIVPEPVTSALVLFAGVTVLAGITRRLRRA